MNVEIRPEVDSDEASIWKVTKLAFEGRSYADGDEQNLIDALRKVNALSVSLVAIADDDLIGQITFSPALIDGISSDWYTLGPVSVHPAEQGKGVGAALIKAGIDAIAKLGAAGCVLTGDPGYYSRHGFVPSPEHCPENESTEHFMLRALNENKPIGKFAFHEAFYGST